MDAKGGGASAPQLRLWKVLSKPSIVTRSLRNFFISQIVRFFPPTFLRVTSVFISWPDPFICDSVVLVVPIFYVWPDLFSCESLSDPNFDSDISFLSQWRTQEASPLNRSPTNHFRPKIKPFLRYQFFFHKLISMKGLTNFSAKPVFSETCPSKRCWNVYEEIWILQV